MKTYPSVLTIAGSDCSGGAGIQADIKTISALGAYAASAITAITVQNTCGVYGIHAVPPEFIKGQIMAVMEDIKPLAVKIGMTGDAATVHVIAETLAMTGQRNIVFDPVMVSTSGCKLMADEAIDAVTRELMPLADIITPNLKEAEALLGRSIATPAEMIVAAHELLRYGSRAVLLKGGHLEGDEMLDVLYVAGEEEPHLFACMKVESRNTHGTGCTLSSAIATRLALGDKLPEAVRRAKQYVSEGIFSGKDISIGSGHGPLNHLFRPESMHIIG